MKSIMRTVRVAAAVAVATAATALGAGPALAAAPATVSTPVTAPAAAQAGPESAVFVQTDNPAGNAVVAYHRGADGRLHQAGVYRTGGKGGVLAGSMVDHLASQGSLAYDAAHHLLYVVNAGSDTVSVFAVDGDRLHRTQVIGSGGSFPVSIAVHDNLVYVANALGGGSIQGFVREGRGLVRIPVWKRELGLNPTATPQFTHTPGQVSFTPNGDALVVTTKAGGNSVDVFPLGRFDAPSTTPVVNALPGAVPFGFTFDRAGRLAVTEAGTNSLAVFDLGRNGRIHPVDSAATMQMATCWVVRTGDHYYASNAGSASLSGFREGPHGRLTALGNTATDPGTVDAAASPDGRDVYVQTGGRGVVDEFRVNPNGSLTEIDSATVPGGVGGEGVVVA